MRLVTFTQPGGTATVRRLGVLLREDTQVLDLTGLPTAGCTASMQSLMESGAAGLDVARDAVADAMAGRIPLLRLSDVRLLSPHPRPPQMRDYGCFPGHFSGAVRGLSRLLAKKHGREMPSAFPSGLPPDYLELPRFYTANPLLVAGHEDDIAWPWFTQYLDFELEFGVFIGKGGKDISRDEAPAHLFGYTIFNDMTARDQQAAEGRTYGKCKDFDNSNILGPCIVTCDEIPDPYNLRMRAWVNGDLWCDASTSSMARTFPDLVAFSSMGQTLQPGEFLASGTVEGGCGLESDRYLQDGDVVELEVESIGRLRNRIVRGPGSST